MWMKGGGERELLHYCTAISPKSLCQTRLSLQQTFKFNHLVNLIFEKCEMSLYEKILDIEY